MTTCLVIPLKYRYPTKKRDRIIPNTSRHVLQMGLRRLTQNFAWTLHHIDTRFIWAITICHGSPSSDPDITLLEMRGPTKPHSPC